MFVPNIVWIFALWFIYLETHHYTKQLLIFEWRLMTSMSYNSLAEKKTERILFQQQQKINKTIIIAERNQNLKNFVC